LEDGVKRREVLHIRLYRRLVNLAPRAHRDRHGKDQIQLFADLVATGNRPWRLWANAIPDLLFVILSHSRRAVVSELARVALFPLSILNAGAGVVLAMAAFFTSAVPAWIVAPAGAIAAQGLYTLLWLTDRAPLAPRAAKLLLVVGEAAAFVVGSSAMVAAVLRQSGTSDPEFGPPTMLVLVVVHGIVGLLASQNQTTDHALQAR
jgi:hypothetical protein